MNIHVLSTPEELGKTAAVYAAKLINQAIEKQGKARIIVSTGASQFEFFKSLIQLNIDWSKVEAFHLDEYINLDETHPASFRRYLKERFLKYVNIGKMHFVHGEGDIQSNFEELSKELDKAPIDLAIIGIGENAHIAFNDPPANFHTKEKFITVSLDEKCRNQQFKEGWFNTLEEVPQTAITMTVHQIMQSRSIISCVPHLNKADAVKLTLEEKLTNEIPATILKTHDRWTLFLDKQSASKLDSY